MATSSPTRHVNVDRTHKLIRRYAVTDAAVHDSRKLNRLLHQGNTSQDVFGGHYAYYGISGNHRRIRWFAWQVVRVWRKWLARRDRQGVFQWSRLNALLKRHPLPPARIDGNIL